MLISLRFKLSLLFILVSLVAVLIVALLVEEAVHNEFVIYCDRLCEMTGLECMETATGNALQNTYLEAINDSLWRAALLAAFVALALAILFSRLLVGPLNALKESARRIRDGDLSRRVESHATDEIGEVAAAFNDMADQLDANEKARKQLLADVVHELRTPLSIIRGNLEAWRDGVVSASPETIAPVHDEAVLLSRLITDLRDLSLAEAGHLKLARETADIVSLAESVVESYRSRASSQEINLELSCQARPLPASVDPGRVRQILRNLLENALRHTPHGGYIWVTVTRTTGPSISVSVRDTGSGISSEDLPHVFEHFYKADRARDRSRSGSGIGLAIVRQLAEAHGGSVTATSEPGNGSTFTFTFPGGQTGTPRTA